MRAKVLLPQFLEPRKFDKEETWDGLREMLWGFFKKIVIADNCATYVNYIFLHHKTLPGSALFLGVLFFSFQIYGDFSGYSDIARGTAKLFGFRLIVNFRLPYFSRNIAEFWKRWHIALSTWFQDYVFIPLGGNRGGKLFHIRNILLTFTISGLWHGANWTFIAWGLLNGLYYVPLIILNKEREFKGLDLSKSILPGIKTISQMLLTFLLILVSWIFFRSANIHQAFEYFAGIFSSSLFSSPNLPPLGLRAGYFIIILVICEWLQRDKDHVLQIEKLPALLRWAIYYSLLALIFLFFKEDQSFIYFQF
jgi:D-alanyl-lipoteichoic acid acyltransferase DltB (MBOAT superfamily)